MRKIYAFYHLFFGEVVRKGTQRKLFSAYIHGVRTEVESSFEFLRLPAGINSSSISQIVRFFRNKAFINANRHYKMPISINID